MNVNGRLQRLEQQAEQQQQEQAEAAVIKLPGWLEYPGRTFEAGTVRPGVMARENGRDTLWHIHGPWVHFFIHKLREWGIDVPKEFYSLAECQDWIIWLTDAFWDVKAQWLALVEKKRNEP